MRVVGGLHSPNREMLKSNFTRPTPLCRLWGRFSNGFPLQKEKETQKNSYNFSGFHRASCTLYKQEQLTKRLHVTISAGFAAIFI